jgi:PAS domain S-box-containing protein
MKDTQNQLRESLAREQHLKKVLTGIRKVNQLITREHDPAELTRQACENLTQSLGYFHAWIALVDQEGRVTATGTSCKENDEKIRRQWTQKSSLPLCMQQALKTRRLIIYEEMPENCGDCPLSDPHSGRAALIYVLEHNDIIYGVLNVSAPSVFAGNKEEQELFQEVAQDLAFALYNIEAEQKRHISEQKLKERIKELSCIAAVGKELQTATSTASLCHQISEHLKLAMARPDQLSTVIELSEKFYPVKEKTTIPEKHIHSAIASGTETFGNIWMYYEDGHAFLLPEEQQLLNNVTTLIGQWCQRRQAMHSLQQSEESLRITLSSIGDGMIATDMTGCITRMNEVAERMTGWALPQSLGRPLEEIFHIINAFSRKKVTNPVNLVLQHGKIVGLANHTVLIDKNGGELQIADTAAPILNDKGEMQGVVLVFSDVTEKYLAEEKIRQTSAALIEQKQFFEQKFLQSSVSTQILDKDGWCERINPRLTELFGVQPEHIEGKVYNIFRDQQIIDKGIIPILEKTFKRGEPSSWEVEFDIGKAAESQQITVSERKTVWFRNWAFAVTDEHGEVQKVIIQHMDITREKHNLEALKTSDRIFNNSVDMICLAGFDGYFKNLNPAWSRTLGWSTEELLSKPWLELVHPDDKHKTEHIGTTLVDGKEAYQFENRYLCKDGNYKWLAWNSYPYPEEKIMFGVARDITEKKHTDQMQKALYGIASAVVYSDNLEELIAYIYEQLNKLIAAPNFYIALYDQETGMLSIPFEKSEKNTIPTFPAHKTLTGLVIENRESLLIKKDEMEELARKGIIELLGTYSEVWLGVPLYSEGNLIGVLAMQNYDNPDAFGMKDLHALEFISNQVSLAIHRKKTYEELVEAKEKAEQSDLLKTAFLNNLSHEIRTPMNAIVGFAEYLNEEGLSKERVRYVTRVINQSGQQLLSIINDIINMASIESGLVEAFSKETNINQLLKNVYEQTQPGAAAKHIKYRYNSRLKDLEAIVLTDETKLQQILTNLVDNAIKFTDEGHVEFGCAIQENMLQFYVADTGPGIPADMQATIFERFRQGDIELSVKKSGMGLGLSISKSFAELLGGKIWLESEPGSGSVFYFSIPYQPVKKETDIGSKALKTYPELKNKTILVAEDEENNYELIKVILSTYEMNVLHAWDGLQASRMAEDSPDIDLVLMDIKMPVMNGLEATRKIKSIKPKLPIIALTAYAMPGDEEKAMEAGCDAYLTKPLSMHSFLKIVQKQLSDQNTIHKS